MTDLATARISPEPVTDAAPVRSHLVKRLLYHKTFVIGAIGLMVIVLIALCAPILAPHDPMTQDLANSLAPPFWSKGGSLNHPLGTDTLGRDVASRLMYGARNSLVIAFRVLLASLLGLARIVGWILSWLVGSVSHALRRHLAPPSRSSCWRSSSSDYQ
jgi:peptide/nickel transport system permease protein